MFDPPPFPLHTCAVILADGVITSARPLMGSLASTVPFGEFMHAYWAWQNWPKIKTNRASAKRCLRKIDGEIFAPISRKFAFKNKNLNASKQLTKIIQELLIYAGRRYHLCLVLIIDNLSG